MQNGLPEAKIKVSAGLCSFWKLQGSPFLCLFQHRGAAHIPWLMVSPSILEASSVTSLNLLLTVFIRATWIIQKGLSISGSFP